MYLEIYLHIEIAPVFKPLMLRVIRSYYIFSAEDFYVQRLSKFSLTKEAVVGQSAAAPRASSASSPAAAAFSSARGAAVSEKPLLTQVQRLAREMQCEWCPG